MTSQSSRRQKKSHVNHERWLVSFADFMTLIFALFVVLYATSKADLKKQAKAAQVRQGIREGGRVWDSWTGGDAVQGIANHIRKDQGYERSRVDQAGQTSAFELVEVFAHRVDLLDGCTAGQQGGSGALKIGQADAGRRQGHQG